MLIESEPDCEVAFECETAATALEIVISNSPDLVLTDITLPGRSGLELIKDIHAVEPDLPILVISMHDESLYAERALRAGARGYIMKHEGGPRLMQAVRRVLGGHVYVSDRTSERVLALLSGRPNLSQRPGIERLSDREFDVFQLLGQGLSAHDIGDRLHLCLKTTSELISYAARWIAHQTIAPARQPA